MAMGPDFEMRLDGAERVSSALADAQKTLKERTVPVMRAAAESIAHAATARAQQHPSGLWRRSRRGRPGKPGYRVKVNISF